MIGQQHSKTGKDLYQSNLAILASRYQDLAERLQSVDFEDTVEVIASAFGLPTFFYTDGTGKRRLFHSQYNPLKEAYQIIEGKKLEDKRVIFVLGLGFGYHVLHLLKNAHFTGRIIIIEPSLEIFKAALQSCDLTEVFSNVRVNISVDPDIGKMRDALYRTKWLNECDLLYEIVYMPVYRQVFAEYYQQILDEIVLKMSRRIMDFNAIDELSNAWEQNILDSLFYMGQSVPISFFADKWRGKPGIIVAAGPSLDKNIDDLHKIKDTAMIISVGTALKPLLKKGIVPDFTIAVDASEVTYAQYEGIKPMPETWLICEPAAYAKITPLFYPRVSFFYTINHPIMGYIYPHNELPSMYLQTGGSVANSALDCLIQWGLNPIVFVGQDLCFAQDGKSHARHTMHEDSYYDVKTAHRDMLKIPGNYDDEATAPRNFYVYLRWTENLIRKNPAIEFINATAGGARIEGTKLMTLPEVAGRFASAPVIQSKEILREALRQKPGKYRNDMSLKLKQVYLSLRKIEPLLRKGLVTSRQMAAIQEGRVRMTDVQRERFMKKAQELFLAINQYEIMGLLNYTLQKETMQMFIQIEKSRFKENGYAGVVQRMPAAFEKIVKSSRHLQQELRKLFKKIR